MLPYSLDVRRLKAVTQTSSDNQYINSRVLRINVGFLISEGPGFSRDTELHIPQRVRVSDDVTVQGLDGELRLTRTSEGILVQGSLHSQTEGICTRCLSKVGIDLRLEIEELFGLNANMLNAFVVGDDYMIDLAPLIREEALIGIPTQIFCKEDCLGLCPDCGQNRNEGSCTCADDYIDPRWAALAKLKQKLSEDDV